MNNNNINAEQTAINTKGSTSLKRELVDVLVFLLTLLMVAPIVWTALQNPALSGATTVCSVAGDSMYPTMENGQLFVINRNIEPTHGDIIAAECPKTIEQFTNIPVEDGVSIVKRVIATPGQTVDINNDNTISIDGVVIEESYLTDEAHRYTYIANQEHHFELADDEYFVVGDNRKVSCDSRYFGTISADSIMGVAAEDNESTVSLVLTIAKYAAIAFVAYLLIEKLLTVLFYRLFKV